MLNAAHLEYLNIVSLPQFVLFATRSGDSPASDLWPPQQFSWFQFRFQRESTRIPIFWDSDSYFEAPLFPED